MTLRNFGNRMHGAFASWRVAREGYRARTLLVANHWDGSVQQFYHFMLGYFLPLCEWLDRHPGTPITVRDCGPMNIWWEVLRETNDIDVVPPGSALHAVVGDRTKHVILRGLDDPTTFDRRVLERARDSMLRILDIPSTTVAAARGAHLVVVDRATSEDFYHGPDSETHMSGGERRSTPNLAELIPLLGNEVDVELIDLARMTPRDQIHLMQRKTILVGQHGAAFAHLLWMPEGSTIIEIAPPLPSQVEEIFSSLSKVMGHRFRRVQQQSVHADVDLPLIHAIVHEALQSQRCHPKLGHHSRDDGVLDG